MKSVQSLLDGIKLTEVAAVTSFGLFFVALIATGVESLRQKGDRSDRFIINVLACTATLTASSIFGNYANTDVAFFATSGAVLGIGMFCLTELVALCDRKRKSKQFAEQEQPAKA